MNIPDKLIEWFKNLKSRSGATLIETDGYVGPERRSFPRVSVGDSK